MIRERLPKATIITFWHIPVAQRRDLRHLPVARGDHRRPARQHHPGLPHAVPLQQLHRRDRPLHREPDRPRARLGHVRRPRDADPALSDLDRMAAGGACGPGSGAGMPGGASSNACSAGRCAHRRRHRALRLHQGHSRPHAAVDDLLTRHPEWKGSFVFVQVAAPTRSKLAATARCRTMPCASPTRSMPGTATDDFQPIRLVVRHHEPERGLRAVPRRGHVHRLQPARRHEPRRQGVRRGARRRAGRAHPVELRRRLPRAVRGADRQSLRHPRDGRGARPALAHAARTSSASACA